MAGEECHRFSPGFEIASVDQFSVGWPGLKGDNLKSRGFPHFVQSELRVPNSR